MDIKRAGILRGAEKKKRARAAAVASFHYVGHKTTLENKRMKQKKINTVENHKRLD